MWELCWTMLLVGAFSRGSPVSLASSFRRCSILTSITLIGSEDLDNDIPPCCSAATLFCWRLRLEFAVIPPLHSYILCASVFFSVLWFIVVVDMVACTYAVHVPKSGFSIAIGCCLLQKASSYLTGPIRIRQHRHGSYVIRMQTDNTCHKRNNYGAGGGKYGAREDTRASPRLRPCDVNRAADAPPPYKARGGRRKTSAASAWPSGSMADVAAGGSQTFLRLWPWLALLSSPSGIPSPPPAGSVAAVAERLARSPYAKAVFTIERRDAARRVRRSPPATSAICQRHRPCCHLLSCKEACNEIENRVGRCRWSAGILGDLPFPPSLHYGAAPYSACFTLIGSQDPNVKSRPNLFTHSLFTLQYRVIDYKKSPEASLSFHLAPSPSDRWKQPPPLPRELGIHSIFLTNGITADRYKDERSVTRTAHARCEPSSIVAALLPTATFHLAPVPSLVRSGAGASRPTTRLGDNPEERNRKLQKDLGAAVTERLVCSPLTKAIRVQSPAGSLQISARGNRAGRFRWSAGLLGDLPFPPRPFIPALLHTALLIGSQDLDIKSRQNIFTSLQNDLSAGNLPVRIVDELKITHMPTRQRTRDRRNGVANTKARLQGNGPGSK
ncbi:hypothetical protein PR048_024379 [Dryococelus australis]|uniref:Uncharacterized protein n=1 Tax=Dryococelus australis TaxID=614101 RepID=A0ABQ9GNG0_9NEOP|nr:hypothetical protein PR048_024379 [Dryococelus australis]